MFNGGFDPLTSIYGDQRRSNGPWAQEGLYFAFSMHTTCWSIILDNLTQCLTDHRDHMPLQKQQKVVGQKYV